MFLKHTEKQSLKETEGIKKNKMEILEVKNNWKHRNKLNSSMQIPEERVSEIEGGQAEIIQSEKKKKKSNLNNKEKKGWGKKKRHKV